MGDGPPSVARCRDPFRQAVVGHPRQFRRAEGVFTRRYATPQLLGLCGVACWYLVHQVLFGLLGDGAFVIVECASRLDWPLPGRSDQVVAMIAIPFPRAEPNRSTPHSRCGDSRLLRGGERRCSRQTVHRWRWAGM